MEVEEAEVGRGRDRWREDYRCFVDWDIYYRVTWIRVWTEEILS